ncbi:ethanolamine ammonia-lyase subunit EutB [Parendozoicomonas haliclonae]|uniref:Ethanolamine ammonia-lyase heavy chain n=1 Tax=Parendozoicomonas haliclonae TaxID=1960125 RepID=A0A1X7ALZ7_9GAMM|nr:ethanolamine ammonia-lyase subunit EutB [Parendozoicomonas haliclonae]SMA48861.1 Ethanolamine ammonia-lyase heavy chain [Parendozoicomonas haliclonae]
MSLVNHHKPLDQIVVPVPAREQVYRMRVAGQEYSFQGLAALLGAADYSKAGDRGAGLAVDNEIQREAARSILADLTLQHIYDHPLTTREGDIDEVMVVNYNIDHDVFGTIAQLTLGELRDRFMECTGPELLEFGTGMTGVMVAAVTKLMSVHDLVFNARKMRCHSQLRNHLGFEGTLSSRIQPNHPTDDLAAITAMVLQGLSMGNGDQVIGLNPSDDTFDNIAACLTHLDQLRKQTGAPTQVCVLSHIRTQLACIEEGVPVDVLFQSLAGTDKTLRRGFDVSVSFMDKAWETMNKKGALAGKTEQFMYFETGQGSEISYGYHEGIDMATAEALTYGLCRRYTPGMVNSVTGFIGPETHANSQEIIISNLQDLFMGKLMGLPMGVSPCFTMHADAGVEGQEMAVQLLTSAGAQYFVDIHLGVDRMLSYADTSGHDNQTMREMYNLRPAPEFWHWCLDKKIFIEDKLGRIRRGPNWGKPEAFCDSRSEFDDMMKNVPMNYGYGSGTQTPKTAGPRMSSPIVRELRMNMAVARQAATSYLNMELLEQLDIRLLDSRASSLQEHHSNPAAGCFLAVDSFDALAPEQCDIQIVVTDGLSAEAVNTNVMDVLPVLEDGLLSSGLKLGKTIVVPHGRVKLAEDIVRALGCKLVIMLLGERPGAGIESSRSMSAYLVYHLTDEESLKEARLFAELPGLEFEDSVIPNIYQGGTPPLEAGAIIVEQARQILHHKAAGNRLKCLQGFMMGLPGAADLPMFHNKQDDRPVGGIRFYDFGNQMRITEADIMILGRWEVREMLVSRRAVLSPLAMDLLAIERIKIRYNDQV